MKHQKIYFNGQDKLFVNYFSLMSKISDLFKDKFIFYYLKIIKINLMLFGLMFFLLIIILCWLLFYNLILCKKINLVYKFTFYNDLKYYPQNFTFKNS